MRLCPKRSEPWGCSTFPGDGDGWTLSPAGRDLPSEGSLRKGISGRARVDVRAGSGDESRDCDFARENSHSSEVRFK